MALKYKVEFEVEGYGDFPLDMLRYDGCFPSGSDDAAKIMLTFTGERASRRVKLIKYSETKEPNITDARWNSFGWGVRNASAVKLS